MNKKYALVILGTAIIGGIILLAWYRAPQIGLKTTGKLQVVASFYPMFFFASQIGGSKADVFTITPMSAEPHDYEPTLQDIARITNANMLVLNGGALEAWGVRIKEQLQGTNVVIVTAGTNLANNMITENGTTIQDPHVWLDPLLAKQEVETIENGYERADPSDALYFKQNTITLENKLDELDKKFQSGLYNCQKRDFITSHAAFGYLSARYGIHQISISGLSPDEEPSSQKLAEIADLVKKEKIPVIFFERLVSPKLSQTIASETGVQTMVLDPIEGISDDNQKEGKTYFSVMRDNLYALQKALVCNK